MWLKYVGGAITLYNATTIFDDNTIVIFTNNSATNIGGALNSRNNADIVCKGNSSVIFSNNHAKRAGSALSLCGSNYTSKGNSIVVFYNNKDTTYGGAIFCYSNCNFAFKENASLNSITTVQSLVEQHILELILGSQLKEALTLGLPITKQK